MSPRCTTCEDTRKVTIRRFSRDWVQPCPHCLSAEQKKRELEEHNRRIAELENENSNQEGRLVQRPTD